jgi:hypothetical protein
MEKQKRARRNPREDRTRPDEVHSRSDNPEAGADVVLGSLLEVVRGESQIPVAVYSCNASASRS